jgi:hypothetical protein
MRSRKPTGKTSHGDNIKWLDRDDMNYMKWYEEVRRSRIKQKARGQKLKPINLD